MSFILDALRKSEHERQRSATPGLAQIPLATPKTELPRWTVVVIGVLGAAVLALGAAWWQSTRARVELAAAPAAAPPVVERPVALPPPPASAAPQPTSTPVGEPLRSQSALATAAAPSSPEPLAAPASSPPAPSSATPAADEPALPSAAALAAEGIVLPSLRIELHRFRERSSERFVFINGRKYVEGDRLTEGPQLVSIVPSGAVLVHSGRRFMLVPE